MDDLETVTGELVAHALEHYDSRLIAISLVLSITTTTMSVTHEGTSAGQGAMVPIPPSRLPGSQEEAEEEHGRGLLITAALATRWGQRRAGGGLPFGN